MGTYTGQDKRLKYLFENGGGGGGGTDVQANPQGTPTDYLNTIKIANSIYSVEKPADIYSTEEKQVGVWIDGRPIYKRTYDLGSDVSVSYNSWTTLSAVVIPNLDFIVKGYGTNVGGTYTPLQTTWVVATHAIQIQTPRNNYNQNVRYFTIFYCKDNDTPGSGIWTPQGSYAHHYSETEQIVGTWIDGRTLYEKTVKIPALPSTPYSLISYPHNIANVYEICLWRGYIKFSSGSVQSMPTVQFSQNAIQTAGCNFAQVTPTEIAVMVGTDRSGASGVFVIQYTKTV